MTIPDGQIWMLHHTGHAYYWTRWLDAPLVDDKVDGIEHLLAHGVFVSSAWLVGQSWAERWQ